MVSYDIRKFDPFFVGVDRVWKHLDELHAMTSAPTSNYPPYNIRKLDEDHYGIEMAIAGFTEDDLDLTLEDGKLTINGKVTEKDEPNLVYKGISSKAFSKAFTLADTIEIDGAELTNGMLLVLLKNNIPDHKKPKKIEVTTGGKLLGKAKEFLTEAVT
jgi:molecular chaperone IbpA